MLVVYQEKEQACVLPIKQSSRYYSESFSGHLIYYKLC